MIHEEAMNLQSAYASSVSSTVVHVREHNMRFTENEHTPFINTQVVLQAVCASINSMHVFGCSNKYTSINLNLHVAEIF
jgi:hypothetical protein